MVKRAQRCRGQVTVETAVLFGVVVTALVAMAFYLQRGVQGGVKSNADSFGTQFSAKTAWTTKTSSDTTETNASILSNQSTNYNQTGLK